MKRTLSTFFTAAILLAGAFGLRAEDSPAWQTDCSSIKDWYDNKINASFQAKIEQAEPSVFKITQDGGDSWGKVSFVIKELNVDQNPVIEVKVNKVDKDSAFKIGVASLDWTDFYEVVPRTSADGIHKGDIKKATGWSGKKDFNLVIIVEGKAKGTYVDNIKIIAN